MRAGDSRATVEWVQYGQPRPYSDSYYEFDIILEQVSHTTGEWVPRELNDDLVKERAKVLGRFWREKDDPKACWASPLLTGFSKKAPGKWRIHVTEAFTD